MSKLMISVAGIRGIVGETVFPDLFCRYATAFAVWLGAEKSKIIIGRDSRISGEMLRNAICAGLVSGGAQIIDLGICATPTVAMQVRKQNASGGIMLSASHNPIQWNALKLIWNDGIFLNADKGKEFLNYFQKNQFQYADIEHLGSIQNYPTALDEHQEIVLSQIDVELIKKRNFRIVLDPCNGVGGLILLPLLKKLNCQVMTINELPNGRFAHNPEPLPENLLELAKSVKTFNADLGIAVDPDADRVAYVSEFGEPIGEEYGLALVIDYILNKIKSGELKKPISGPPIIVVNLSTTRVIDDIAQKYNAHVIRTPIGEAHVARRMISEPNCVIGGEGNGGVIYPPTHYGRDAAIGTGLLLELLAKKEIALSQAVAQLPKYYIIKDKLELDIGAITTGLNKIKNEFSMEKIDLMDGIKINFPDSWVHIRPSGTEPIIRIIAEAASINAAKQLTQRIKSILNK